MNIQVVVGGVGVGGVGVGGGGGGWWNGGHPETQNIGRFCSVSQYITEEENNITNYTDVLWNLQTN